MRCSWLIAFVCAAVFTPLLSASAAPAIPEIPQAVRKELDAFKYPQKLSPSDEVVELIREPGNSRLFVANVDRVVLAIVMRGNKAKLEASMATQSRRSCEDAESCALEAHLVPDLDPQRTALFVRTREGCVVVRWKPGEKNRGENNELLNCNMTARDYVLAWADCRAKGGTRKGQGLSRGGVCVIPAPDAGQACTDGAQCAFGCVTRGAKNADGSLIGMCKANDSRFGCYSFLGGSKVTQSICVD